MSADEILACARNAAAWGWGTVVLQSGEDYGLKTDWIADVVRRIKAETDLAVTLSFGERPEADLAAWREAGADRYLLRFETSDEALYRLIHPDLPGRRSDRMALLRTLQRLGYEAGSGIMVGIPGQTYESVADDIDLFRGLDLDMIGIGPYIAHPRRRSATAAGRGRSRPRSRSRATSSPSTRSSPSRAWSAPRPTSPAPRRWRRSTRSTAARPACSAAPTS